jgi:hypothetical protein
MQHCGKSFNFVNNFVSQIGVKIQSTMGLIYSHLITQLHGHVTWTATGNS